MQWHQRRLCRRSLRPGGAGAGLNHRGKAGSRLAAVCLESAGPLARSLPLLGAAISNPSKQVGLGTLPPGTEVDGWRVQDVLGRGGGGTVYAAEPLRAVGAGRFALKLASRPQDLRFQREVELLSRFVHS